MPTPSDPYYNNTVLHLPFDSDLRDKSLFGNAVTAFGNVAVTTAEKKYGAGSAVFDGNSDYLEIDDKDSLRVCSGDFTLEAWVFVSAWTKVVTIAEKYYSLTSGFSWQTTATGRHAGILLAGGYTSVTSKNPIPTNSWSHIAFTKYGNTVRVFTNGILDGELVLGYSGSDDASKLLIGKDTNDASRDFAGRIDDFRITKGVARYTENFTPPGAIEYFNWSVSSIDAAISSTESYTYAPYAPPHAVHLPTIAPGPISGIRGGTEYGGRGRIVGTVKNKTEPADTPVYRRVRLFKDRDGQCVAETWSDPVTGAYAFENINPAHKYTALSYDHTGQFRAVVADNLTPEVF